MYDDRDGEYLWNIDFSVGQIYVKTTAVDISSKAHNFYWNRVYAESRASSLWVINFTDSQKTYKKYIDAGDGRGDLNPLAIEHDHGSAARQCSSRAVFSRVYFQTRIRIF